MIAPAPRLSGVRTFLLVGLAVVWLGEGVLTGVQPLAEGWTRFWKMFPPESPTLAAALYTTPAFEAGKLVRHGPLPGESNPATGDGVFHADYHCVDVRPALATGWTARRLDLRDIVHPRFVRSAALRLGGVRHQPNAR